MNNKPNWHIPIIKGRYFNKNDIDKEISSVIIGKEIEKELNLTTGDKINLNGHYYNIIGISGRKYSNTQWDDLIYILYTSKDQRFICNVKDEQKILKLTFVVRANITNSKNDVKKILYNNYNDDIYIKSIDTATINVDKSIIKNVILITFILGSIIIIISMINTFNIINLWMLDRKFEFSIMRAFGATEKYIFKLIFLEITLITFTASVSAIIFHLLVWKIFKQFFILKEIIIEMKIINTIIILLASIVFGALTSIHPIKKSLKFSIVEILKEN
ncbi:MAG: ABC transporter permease [Clostridiales bacterium]